MVVGGRVQSLPNARLVPIPGGAPRLRPRCWGQAAAPGGGAVRSVLRLPASVGAAFPDELLHVVAEEGSLHGPAQSVDESRGLGRRQPPTLSRVSCVCGFE